MDVEAAIFAATVALMAALKKGGRKRGTEDSDDEQVMDSCHKILLT